MILSSFRLSEMRCELARQNAEKRGVNQSRREEKGREEKRRKEKGTVLVRYPD
jgi:hypothetical protein